MSRCQPLYFDEFLNLYLLFHFFIAKLIDWWIYLLIYLFIYCFIDWLIDWQVYLSRVVTEEELVDRSVKLETSLETGNHEGRLMRHFSVLHREDIQTKILYVGWVSIKPLPKVPFSLVPSCLTLAFVLKHPNCTFLSKLFRLSLSSIWRLIFKFNAIT